MTTEVDQFYKCLPVDLIEVEPQLALLRRGTVKLQISGPASVAAIRVVLERCRSGRFRLGDIADHFCTDDRPEILKLLGLLRDRRFIVSSNCDESTAPVCESRTDIFHWSLGIATEDVTATFKDRTPVIIVGINRLTHAICAVLEQSGSAPFQIVDYPLLNDCGFCDREETRNWLRSRNVAALDEAIAAAVRDQKGLFLAGLDFGGMALLRELNAKCIEHSLTFFPVAIQDCIGYVGPIAIPRETACYECLRGRQNAHLDNPTEQRLFEMFSHQHSAGVALHPTMLLATAAYATCELIRFVAWKHRPPFLVNAMLEVNLMQGTAIRRPILRIPRCPVCSSMLDRSSTNLLADMHIPTKGFSR